MGRILLWICVILIVGNNAYSQNRLDGKYGLYVYQQDEEWRMRWMSTEPIPGWLSITTNNETTEIEGPVSTIHDFALPEANATIEFATGKNQKETIQLDFNPAVAPVNIEGVDSLLIFGDVHGNFDQTVSTLRNFGVIDNQNQWTGGKLNLVFAGDVLDRGADATRLMWFIYDLEQSARENGGSVHMVLGNHEVMVMTGDLRYVSAKEKYLASTFQISYQDLFDPERSLIGRWLKTKPIAIRIDDVLICHGGMITSYGDFDIEVLNDSTRSFMKEKEFASVSRDEIDSTNLNLGRLSTIKGFFYDPYGPLWFRGYVRSDTLGPYLDYVMEQFGAEIQVVGHTPVAQIQSRYNKKFYATNLEVGGSAALLLVRKKRKYESLEVLSDGSTREVLKSDM